MGVHRVRHTPGGKEINHDVAWCYWGLFGKRNRFPRELRARLRRHGRIARGHRERAVTCVLSVICGVYGRDPRGGSSPLARASPRFLASVVRVSLGRRRPSNAGAVRQRKAAERAEFHGERDCVAATFVRVAESSPCVRRNVRRRRPA